jgi:hypothetical protein
MKSTEAEPSPSDTVSYPVRWRGQTVGSYSAAALRQKLRAQQIGLLHEVLDRGNWITLGTFLRATDSLEESRKARVETEQKEREQSKQKLQQSRSDLQAEILNQREHQARLLLSNPELTETHGALPANNAKKPNRLVAAIVVLLIAVAIYSLIYGRIQADRALAEATKLRAEKEAKAQENVAAMNAAASVVNKVIDGAVEVSKPPTASGVIIINK